MEEYKTLKEAVDRIKFLEESLEILANGNPCMGNVLTTGQIIMVKENSTECIVLTSCDYQKDEGTFKFFKNYSHAMNWLRS